MLRIQAEKKQNSSTYYLGKVFDYEAEEKREKKKYYLKLTIEAFLAFVLGLIVSFLLENCQSIKPLQ